MIKDSLRIVDLSIKSLREIDIIEYMYIELTVCNNIINKYK